jgi:hypothetical protein
MGRTAQEISADGCCRPTSSFNLSVRSPPLLPRPPVRCKQETGNSTLKDPRRVRENSPPSPTATPRVVFFFPKDLEPRSNEIGLGLADLKIRARFGRHFPKENVEFARGLPHRGRPSPRGAMRWVAWFAPHFPFRPVIEMALPLFHPRMHGASLIPTSSSPPPLLRNTCAGQNHGQQWPEETVARVREAHDPFAHLRGVQVTPLIPHW